VFLYWSVLLVPGLRFRSAYGDHAVCRLIAFFLSTLLARRMLIRKDEAAAAPKRGVARIAHEPNLKEQTMSAAMLSSQHVPAEDDGTDLPEIPREPDPPTTEDLPDLPEPQEVGEDG
jgi:hypothetical protein